MKKIDFTGKISLEDRLQQVAEKLEDLKEEFADVVDACEEKGLKQNALFSLSEALAAVDDAIDGLQDALDEMK